MITLNTTTRKLQAVLGAAVAANQLPILVGWADKTTTTYTAGATPSNSNSTTAVDICAAPGASTVREIDSIIVRNRDTAAATLTIRYNDNATTYDIFTVTLSAGHMLVYAHGTGWQVMDSLGRINTGSVMDDLGSAAYLDADSVVLTGAPATITAASYSVSSGDTNLIFNTSATHTLTLLSAASYPGRTLDLKNVAAYAINSASSNIVPLAGGAAGTGILAATAGKYCRLRSDGSNWQIMGAN